MNTSTVCPHCSSTVVVPLMSSDDPQPLHCDQCGFEIFGALRGPVRVIPAEFWDRLRARRAGTAAALACFYGLVGLLGLVAIVIRLLR